MFIGAKALTFNSGHIVGYGYEDGLPRNEINDNTLRLKKPIEELSRIGNHKYRLGDILDHPELFKAYPGLKRTLVRIQSTPDNTDSNGFSRDSGEISMAVRPNTDPDNFLDGITHEIQHSVQQVEGFSGGSGHSDFVEQVYKKLSTRLMKRARRTGNTALSDKVRQLGFAAGLVDDGYRDKAQGVYLLAANQLIERSARMYLRVPGEVEARACANRRKLNGQERAASPSPHLTSQPTDNPVVRQYNNYEYQVLSRHAARTTLVLLGEQVTGKFNALFKNLRPNSVCSIQRSMDASRPGNTPAP